MFKFADVAPIMNIGGTKKAIPCSVYYELQPKLHGGTSFHCVVYTKVVDGVQTLGGVQWWTPEELKDNILRVGTMNSDGRNFKATLQNSINTGGITPQVGTVPATPPPPSTDQIIPVAGTPQESVVVPDAQVVSEAQKLVDELDTIGA